MVKLRVEANRVQRMGALCTVCEEELARGETICRTSWFRLGEWQNSLLHTKCLVVFIEDAVEEARGAYKTERKPGAGRPPLRITDSQRKIRVSWGVGFGEMQKNLITKYVGGDESKINKAWLSMHQKLVELIESEEHGPGVSITFREELRTCVKNNDPLMNKEFFDMISTYTNLHTPGDKYDPTSPRFFAGLLRAALTMRVAETEGIESDD